MQLTPPPVYRIPKVSVCFRVLEYRYPILESLPCLGLKSYCTRTKLRFCLHIFAHPDSRRGVSRKSLFVIVEPHSNIQKKSLEEKGVNIVGVRELLCLRMFVFLTAALLTFSQCMVDSHNLYFSQLSLH